MVVACVRAFWVVRLPTGAMCHFERLSQPVDDEMSPRFNPIRYLAYNQQVSAVSHSNGGIMDERIILDVI